jgi:hypothetical protein
MILDEQSPIESDQFILSLLLEPFPDERKKTDGCSWLTMHFALALGNKVREEDIHEVHRADPLSLQRYGYKFKPCHFLCMHHPNISLISYLSLRDLRVFSIHETDTMNALQLAAKYFENMELLQILLQIDLSMPGGRQKSTSHFIAWLSLCKICILILHIQQYARVFDNSK